MLILPLLLQVAISAIFTKQLFAVIEEVERRSNARDFVMQCYELESKVIDSFANLTLTIDNQGLINADATRRDSAAIGMLVTKLVSRCRTEPKLEIHAKQLQDVFNESQNFVAWCLQEQAKGMHNWKRANNEVPGRIIALCDQFMQSFNALIDTQRDAQNISSEAVHSAHGSFDSSVQWQSIKQFLNLCLAITALLSIGLISLFAVSIRKPLSSISRRCTEIAENMPLSPPLENRNELGELDRLIFALGKNLNETLKNEKAMVSNARDLICSIDANGKVVSANNYSEILLGYSAVEIIGKFLTDLCVPADASRADNVLEQALKSTETQDVELTLQRKDQSEVVTRWSFVRTEDAIFAVVHDITEENNLAKLKQDFLNMVSHDLRSPLTSLMGSFSLLSQGAKGDLPESAKKEIVSALRNSERLIEFISDFLDLQKIESGNIQLEIQTINLSALLDDAIELLKGAFDSKRIQLTFEPSEISVAADRAKLTRVLQNLLSNAIAFSSEGGKISIEIEPVRNETMPDQQIEIRVTDEGQGVSEEYRETIFQPFMQAPGTPSKQGTGLGLAICKLIVEAHKGEIGVSDNPKVQGAMFWIRLPG